MRGLFYKIFGIVLMILSVALFVLVSNVFNGLLSANSFLYSSLEFWIRNISAILLGFFYFFLVLFLPGLFYYRYSGSEAPRRKLVFASLVLHVLAVLFVILFVGGGYLCAIVESGDPFGCAIVAYMGYTFGSLSFLLGSILLLIDTIRRRNVR